MMSRVLLLLLGFVGSIPASTGDTVVCGTSKYDDAGGMSGEAAAPYIIGGQKARPHEFPWVVSIRWAGYSHLYAHSCMGILIRDNWVLTAGHCVVSNKLGVYVVAAGTNNIFDTNESNPYRQEVEVEDWFWYEDTGKNTYYEGDIAMMKLKTKLELNENVQTVCFGHDTFDYAGEIGVVAGWGEQTYGNGDYSEDLKYIQVEIMTNKKCRTWMNGVSDNMLCAGQLFESEKAPCGGDNGAALVVKRDVWELVGLWGWSSGCAHGSPAVYNRMNKYYEWMETIIYSWPNIPNYP